MNDNHGPVLKVCETFLSIQGESSYAGCTCFFIRLAGCNLHCTYCDTPQAREPGRDMDVDTLVRMASESRASILEITGGEPLLQDACPPLAGRLVEATARPVLVETNGTCNVAVLPAGVTAIVDVKCPGSGHGGRFDMANLARLRSHDEVKFVLADRLDYEWARAFVHEHDLDRHCRAVFFSPVHGGLAPAVLASWMLEDGLPVRLQVQLHKILGIA